MTDVAADGHLQTAGKGFENALDFVVLIDAFCFDVEVDKGCVGQAFEEMGEHFGGDVADALALEDGIPDEPWTAAEVDSDSA